MAERLAVQEVAKRHERPEKRLATVGATRLLLHITHERKITDVPKGVEKVTAGDIPYDEVARVSLKGRTEHGVDIPTFVTDLIRFQRDVAKRQEKLMEPIKAKKRSLTDAEKADNVAMHRTLKLMELFGIQKGSVQEVAEAIITHIQQPFLGEHTDIKGFSQEVLKRFKENKEIVLNGETWQEALASTLESKYTHLFFHAFGWTDTAVLLTHTIQALALVDADMPQGKDVLKEVVSSEEFRKALSGNQKQAFVHLRQATEEKRTGRLNGLLRRKQDQQKEGQNEKKEEPKKTPGPPPEELPKVSVPRPPATPKPSPATPSPQEAGKAEQQKQSQPVGVLTRRANEAFAQNRSEWQLAAERMAVARYKNKQYDNALLLWQEIAQKDPHNPYVHSWIGHSYFAVGKYEEALQEYDTALRLNPPNKGPVLVFKGNTLAKIGRHQDALQSFYEAVRADPAKAEPLGYLSNLLWRMRRSQEAVEAAREALRKDPNNNLAKKIMELHQKQQALQPTP